MAFAMDGDRCFYGWPREPIAEKAKAALASPKVKYARRWTDGTHESIVDSVNAWYDKRSAQ